MSELIELTTKQKSVIDFMWDFYLKNDKLPSRSNICREFNWSSPQSVTAVRQALVRKGYIQLNNVRQYKFTEQFHSTQTIRQSPEGLSDDQAHR